MTRFRLPSRAHDADEVGRRPGPAAGVRVLSVLLGLVLAGSLLLPAAGASASPWPVRPDFFGAQDDLRRNNAPIWGAARIWGGWCGVQATAATDPVRAARENFGPSFVMHARAQRSRVVVSLGHPPAWVFGNHPLAAQRGNPHVWYCKAVKSATAFPLANTLSAPGPVRSAYAAYVAAVIKSAAPYLKANAGNRLVLQAWNEPNLGSGGKIKYKIPGAARTWTQAAQSLQAQERLMREVATAMIPGQFEISSPAMYGKSTKLGSAYFKAQARQRTVDSFSLNFYTLHVKSVNASISQWKRKAARAKRVVTKHRSLRNVPIWITETSHSLVNKAGHHRNLGAKWTSPAAQKRMVEVTTLEAMRMRFAGLEWYQGTYTQTALDSRPGTAATIAVGALREALVGRQLQRCTTKKSTTTCAFSARPGGAPVRVSWSKSGSQGVTIR